MLALDFEGNDRIQIQSVSARKGGKRAIGGEGGREPKHQGCRIESIIPETMMHETRPTSVAKNCR